MIPDINFVTTSFAKFNNLIFGNLLPTPEFVLTKARTFRGKLVYKRTKTWTGFRNHSFELRISVCFNSTLQEWEDVMIHEMIHLQIASEGVDDQSAHGPEFRRRMDDINRRFARNISISSRSTPEEKEADTRIRAHYLCIVKFNDGRLGVAPVAKSRIFQLWDMMDKFPDIQEFAWFGSTNPWFNRFPRVLKPKFYIIDRKELTLQLFDGLRLERRDGLLRAVNTQNSPDELLP